MRAPFDGVAISKDAQPGEMISPVSAGGGFTRTGICTIVDMSSLEIEVDVSESYINRVRPNQPVEAVLDAYPDWRIPAHVITTVPTADRQKATVRGAHRLREARPADPARHGRQGVVPSTSEAEPPDGAGGRGLMVPKRRAHDDGRVVVFVVATNGSSAAPSVGATEGDQVEVVSGVNAGERSSSTGRRTLADGARVKVTGAGKER